MLIFMITRINYISTFGGEGKGTKLLMSFPHCKLPILNALNPSPVFLTFENKASDTKIRSNEILANLFSCLMFCMMRKIAFL